METTPEVIDIIIEKLGIKAMLFDKYEEKTKKLLQNIDSKSEDYLNSRDLFGGEIDDITDAINRLKGDDTELINVLNNDCARGELKGKLAEIYDISAKIRGIASRIMDMNMSIVKEMQFSQDELKRKIMQVNSTPRAMATKYYSALGEVPNENLLAEKFRRG